MPPKIAAAAVIQKKIVSQADSDQPNHIGVLLLTFGVALSSI
jgi:hypothetical protein